MLCENQSWVSVNWNTIEFASDVGHSFEFFEVNGGSAWTGKVDMITVEQIKAARALLLRGAEARDARAVEHHRGGDARPLEADGFTGVVVRSQVRRIGRTKTR